MLRTLSATTGRMVVWMAAGIIIILLVGLWVFSVLKPSTLKKPDQNLAVTVIRQKMPQKPMLAKMDANKKVIAVKIPDKPAAETKLQQAAAAEPPAQFAKSEQTIEKKAVTAEAPSEPQAPIRIGQTEKKKASAAEPSTRQPAPIRIDQAEKETAVVAESSTKPQTPPQFEQAEKGKSSADEPPNRQQTPIRIDQTEKGKTVLPAKVTTASLKQNSRPRTIRQQKAKPAPVTAKSAVQRIQRENWLLSQDGSKYTVQVVGVSSEETMLDFIERNKVLKLNKIAYYESTFRGKPWFQLLYGIYPDKRAARLAADKLPDNIRQAGPWIRRIASIQKVIEN